MESKDSSDLHQNFEGVSQGKLVCTIWIFKNFIWIMKHMKCKVQWKLRSKEGFLNFNSAENI